MVPDVSTLSNQARCCIQQDQEHVSSSSFAASLTCASACSRLQCNLFIEEEVVYVQGVTSLD